jgi:hypothetical protein
MVDKLIGYRIRPTIKQVYFSNNACQKRRVALFSGP